MRHHDLPLVPTCGQHLAAISLYRLVDSGYCHAISLLIISSRRSTGESSNFRASVKDVLHQFARISSHTRLRCDTTDVTSDSTVAVSVTSLHTWGALLTALSALGASLVISLHSSKESSSVVSCFGDVSVTVDSHMLSLHCLISRTGATT